MQRRLIAIAGVVLAAGPMVCLLSPRNVFGDNNADVSNDQQHMEREFFNNCQSDNTLEIRESKLAEERSENADVKQAAQMMEQDHTDANRLLKQIADQHHIDVTMDSLTKVDSAMLDELNKKYGEDFTRCFVFSQAGRHTQDELMLTWAMNHGQGDACRDYARQVLPKVENHLRSLEMIARPMAGLSGEPQTAGERMPPTP